MLLRQLPRGIVPFTYQILLHHIKTVKINTLKMVLTPEDLEAANKQMKQITAEFLSDIFGTIGVFGEPSDTCTTHKELRRQPSGPDERTGLYMPRDATRRAGILCSVYIKMLFFIPRPRLR